MNEVLLKQVNMLIDRLTNQAKKAEQDKDKILNQHYNLAGQAREKDENYEVLKVDALDDAKNLYSCLLYTSPSPRD